MLFSCVSNNLCFCLSFSCLFQNICFPTLRVILNVSFVPLVILPKERMILKTYL